MPQGICNKCGEQKELVLAGCVCGDCTDCLDRQWADSRAIDWVLIDWSAELGPLYTFYRNTTYAGMKSLWATWSKQSQPGNNWHLGQYTWSPGTPYSADVAEEVSSHSVAWAKRPDTPFIRPAIPEEIKQRNEIIGRVHILDVCAEVYARWGLDRGGAPLDSRWDSERTTQAHRGAYPEIRNRLEQLGLFTGSVFDDEEMTESLVGPSVGDNKELTPNSSNDNIKATPPPTPERGQSRDFGIDGMKPTGTIANGAGANGDKNLVLGKVMPVAVLVTVALCLLSWLLPALLIGFILALLSVGFLLWMRSLFRIDTSTAKFLGLLIIVIAGEALYLLFRLLS